MIVATEGSGNRRKHTFHSAVKRVSIDLVFAGALAAANRSNSDVLPNVSAVQRRVRGPRGDL